MPGHYGNNKKDWEIGNRLVPDIGTPLKKKSPRKPRARPKRSVKLPESFDVLADRESRKRKSSTKRKSDAQRLKEWKAEMKRLKVNLHGLGSEPSIRPSQSNVPGKTSQGRRVAPPFPNIGTPPFPNIGTPVQKVE